MKREKIIGVSICCAVAMFLPCFLLSFFLTRAVQMQFPPPDAKPLFANSSIVRESTEGDANILQQLLQFHHAVVVLLYRHRFKKKKSYLI